MGKLTYKQLADELGVSKDKIKYQARKLPQTCIEKVGNVTYLTEQGAAKVREVLGEAPAQPAAPAPAENATLALLQATLETLQKQLDEKDAQLRAKDVQIAELTAAVKAQAQSINADRHNELAGTLQAQITGEVPCDAAPVESQRKVWDKLKFWK